MQMSCYFHAMYQLPFYCRNFSMENLLWGLPNAATSFTNWEPLLDFLTVTRLSKVIELYCCYSRQLNLTVSEEGSSPHVLCAAFVLSLPRLVPISTEWILRNSMESHGFALHQQCDLESESDNPRCCPFQARVPRLVPIASQESEISISNILWSCRDCTPFPFSSLLIYFLLSLVSFHLLA